MRVASLSVVALMSEPCVARTHASACACGQSRSFDPRRGREDPDDDGRDDDDDDGRDEDDDDDDDDDVFLGLVLSSCARCAQSAIDCIVGLSSGLLARQLSTSDSSVSLYKCDGRGGYSPLTIF